MNPVYAVKQALPLPIAPDYSENNPTANIFCDTFAAWLDFARHIQHFHDLPLGVDYLWPLTLGGIGRLPCQPAFQALPSWAPDWAAYEPGTVIKLDNQNVQSGRRGGNGIVFSQNSSRQVQLTERRLEVPAVRAEWVHRLGPSLDCQSDKNFWHSLFDFIEQLDRGRRAAQPSIASALYQLLFWNEDHHDPNVGILKDPRFAAMIHLLSDRYASIAKDTEEGNGLTKSHENLMIECMVKLGLDEEVQTCLNLLKFTTAVFQDKNQFEELQENLNFQPFLNSVGANLQNLRDTSFAELLAPSGEKMTFLDMIKFHSSPTECQNSARILSFFLGPGWVPSLRARPWALPHDQSGGGLSGAFARDGRFRDWTTSLRATWLPPLTDEDTESVIKRMKMRFRLAELMDGSLGLLPYGAWSGDVIYVLSGLSVPSVVRYGADGLAKYVGTCVVPGLMEGEIGGLVKKRERVIETLVLH